MPESRIGIKMVKWEPIGNMRGNKYQLEGKIDEDSVMPICDLLGSSEKVEDHSFQFFPILFNSENLNFGIRDMNKKKVVYVARISLKKLYQRLSSTQINHNQTL